MFESFFRGGCKSSDVVVNVEEVLKNEIVLLKKQVEDYKVLMEKKNEEITLLKVEVDKTFESMEQIIDKIIIQCRPLLLNKNYLLSVIENINNLDTTIQMQYKSEESKDI